MNRLSNHQPGTRVGLWRKESLALLVILATLILSGARFSAGQATSGEAYDLIAAVNQLRTANGLPPYQVNGALMAAAQAHSEYQASIGSVTHTGRGGSKAKDRAITAGYGGGATVYVSENIAGGSSMTAQSAVRMWQGDNLHLSTMLGANYQDVGAGAARSGGMVFFTLDVGYIAGSPDTGTSGTNSTPPAGSQPPSAPETAIDFYPILVATTGPDGSIVHTVQPGQALWNIAAAYKIELPQLLELNSLSENALIFPGDQLLIHPPEVETTATPAEAALAAATPTSFRPTRLANESLPPTATATPSTSSLTNSTRNSSVLGGTPIKGLDPILIVIVSLVFGGTLLIIIGNALSRGG